MLIFEIFFINLRPKDRFLLRISAIETRFIALDLSSVAKQKLCTFATASMKTFNTAGTCRPNEHYMVDITERLEIIRKMVAKGDYFCINRGRQYGKTTTLEALTGFLDNDYSVFKISFEDLSAETFGNLASVYSHFLQSLLFNVRLGLTIIDDAATQILEKYADKARVSDMDFAYAIPMLCKANKKPIVILIDEVDQASNNEGFVKFLGVLRNMFLYRPSRPTFQSVILAGVYDIKSLNLTIQHKYYAPWNIAVPFDVDMSLSAEGIKGMLDEYEADNSKGMNTAEVAGWIRDYTGGYPFLVSRICQIIDTQQYSWDREGVQKAVNALLDEKGPFWAETQQIIENDSELKDLLKFVTEGHYVCYEPYAKGMKAALEHDFVKRMKTPVEISSPILNSYIVSFCFRSARRDACQSKNKNKQSGLLPPVELNDRTLIEAIV